MKPSPSSSQKKQVAAKQAGRKKRAGKAALKFHNAQVRAALDSQIHSVYTIVRPEGVDELRRQAELPDESMNGLTDGLRGL